MATAGWLVAALIAAKIAHAVTGAPQPWVYLPFVVLAAVTAAGLVHRGREAGGSSR